MCVSSKSYNQTMKNLVAFILVLCASLSFTESKAQIFDVDNSVDAKYTPPKNSPFYTDKKYSSSGSQSYADHKNAIRWNLTAIARGTIAMEYERNLIENLNACVGGGVTLFPDYLKLVSLTYFDETYSDELIKRAGTGSYMSGELKYYFDFVFDGPFLGLGVRQFNYKAKYEPSTNIVLPDFTETIRDYMLTYGGTVYSGDNFIHEFSMTVGVKTIHSYGYSETSTYVNSSTQTVYEQSKVFKLLPTYFLSYKIGFAFGEK